MNHQNEPDRAIGETTPIRLGLILSVLGVVSAGIIGSAVWVATQLTELRATVGAMQITLNTLVTSGNGLREEVAEHKTEDAREWNTIKMRVEILEKTGTPPLRDLSRELQELRNEFHVYRGLNSNDKKP